MSKYPILPGFLTTSLLRNALGDRTLANGPLRRQQFFPYSLLTTPHSL
ncbi:hypothetical protein [Nostoc sp. C052]|nr:hypothetical protein [Nostoc sp. C052]